MKATAIDPRKLLGYRVLVADALANGRDLDVGDSQLAKTLSTKIGLKPGIKAA